MAIQLRRGNYAAFNGGSNLADAEVGVVTSGDPNTTDGSAVYVDTGTNVHRLLMDTDKTAIEGEIPTKVSDLTNDSGFQTASEVAQATVDNARQLIGSSYITDRRPYVMRAISREVGNRSRVQIVGGTVGWNQLCNGSSVTIPSGHKYYMVKGGVKSIGSSNGAAITGLTSGTDIVSDLTAFFNPTIADYAYSLEQATAGSGIAWLRSFGFLTEDYYPYSQTKLESVQTSAHVIKDANGNVVRTYPTSDVILRGITELVGNEIRYNGDTYDADGTVTRRFAEVDLGGLTWNGSGNGNYFYATLPEQSVMNCNNFVNSKGYGKTTYANGIDLYNGTSDKVLGIALSSISSTLKAVYVRDSSYTTSAEFKTAMSGVKLVYELAAPTTESADPFTSPFVLEEGGTESWTDAGTRDFEMPVGSVSEYTKNITGAVEGIPMPPTAQGNYTLDLSVNASGEPTYAWEPTSMVATANITSGKYFMVGSALFKATASIANGAAIVPGTNCTRMSIADALNALS